MLIKLDEVRHVGRFASLKHKAQQFPRLTLLYARNGHGKSTICAILRSAAERNPHHIAARKRLGAATSPLVRSTWVSGPLTFSGGAWNGTPPKIHIFDHEYIETHLHVADSVTRDNKRSLLPIILGEAGVALARKIVDLDASQRENANKLKALAGQIVALHPSIEDAGAYCRVVVPDDIPLRIAAASRAVELARQTVAVKEKAKPRRIEVIALGELEAVCLSSIDSVSKDAVEVVNAHIQDHQLGPQADRWLKFGVDHHRDACPFCDRPTDGVRVVDALRAYYSTTFNELVASIDDARQSLATIIEPGASNWSAVADNNTKDITFWSSVVELPREPELSTEQRDQIRSGLQALDATMQQKSRAPLAEIDISVNSTIRSAFDAINSYNLTVDACVGPIDGAKQQVESADLKQAETKLAKLVAMGARDTEPMRVLVADYLDADREAGRLAAEKLDAQRKLKAYAPLATTEKQAVVNGLLRNFGADFQIVDAKASFVGREPNTEFAIAIGPSKVAAGQKSDREPSFKTVLSAGDKATLSLAFFITQVLADVGIGDAVVVFDDPFNSQDLGRQWETTSQIRSLASLAGQVIVLSHDPRFLQMIEKDSGGQVGSYQIRCDIASGEGAVHAWSSIEELKELYVRRAEVIREYANHGRFLSGQDGVSVHQALRPFMEDYLRARFPARYPDPLTMLGQMTDEIEQAGPPDPLFARVADLRAINEYSRGAMHGGAPAPDPTALRAQCARVIDIVGSY